MKVLLDECVDPRAAQFFSDDFKVTHVKDLGWLGIKNGDLVKRASDAFDVLFTIDGIMRFQTSLKYLSLLVLVAEGHVRSAENHREQVRWFELNAHSLNRGNYHLLSRRNDISLGIDP